MEHYEKLRYDGSQKNVVDRVMNEAHRYATRRTLWRRLVALAGFCGRATNSGGCLLSVNTRYRRQSVQRVALTKVYIYI